MDHEGIVDAVSARLTEAGTAVAACDAAVVELSRHTDAIIAVLLHGRDQLRCVAATGSWQVFASVPPGAGVSGRVYLSGKTETITAVEGDPDYIPTAPNVTLEICAPIVDRRGRPVGAINLEWTEHVDSERWRETVERIAERLSARLEQLGGAPTETHSEKLLRHAMALTSAASEPQLAAAAVEAARDVAGLTAAVLVLTTPDGPRLNIPVTPPNGLELRIRGRLCTAGRSQLHRLVSRAQRHGALYTLGEPGQDAPDDYAILADAGVRTLIAVPVGRLGAGGVMLVADTQAVRPDAETVNLIELLAAQTWTCLDRLRTLEQLHERAMSDPLTGLRHHGPFAERMTTATPGRTALVAVDVDEFKSINDTYGHQVGDRVLVELARALQAALRHGDELYRIGGDEFVAVVEVRRPAEALEIGERLVRAARAVGRTVSVGVAVQRPGEASEQTLRRADVALYDVKRDGRDGVRLAAVRPAEPPALSVLR
ncbi:sensor domain-containing diguanylate cyclase [Micromonospora pattaloongensis]|uniref:sensor domain-containing diguanylate cyclase n=1 Tax=Micromonospora pattaloongensis TaxID=405436 RepID=UPI000B87ED93|nr:sensor domain-containing diguanylate cyclase [Micromonospora pattaloongensis]